MSLLLVDMFVLKILVFYSMKNVHITWNQLNHYWVVQ
jgi:hypothetical protein